MLSGFSPFLTTREFFHLKADPALYERYAAVALSELPERPLPGIDKVTRPLQPHAEWKISTSALCGWMEKVAELGVTQINPGPLDQFRWQRLSYKGGSEIGVLNLTASVRDGTGANLCVSTTWNATRPIEQESLIELYATLFLSLRD